MSEKNILGLYVSQIYEYEDYSEVIPHLVKNFDVSHIDVSRREDGSWLRTIFFQNVPEKFIDRFDRILLEQIKQKSPQGSWNIYLIDKEKLLDLKLNIEGQPFDNGDLDLESDDPFGMNFDNQSDKFYFLKSNHIKFKVEEWVRMSFVPERFGKFDFQSPYGLHLKSSGILLREYSDHEMM